jgi:glyoxylase-like metal-dependent hydrolase (beta-lactamase superfamily II)
VSHRRREPAPGVFRLVLPLPFPGLDHANAYLLGDDDELTLVDCGMFNQDPDTDHGWDHLAAAVTATGFDVESVVRLVVTHPHIDHYGMAARMLKATGCELWMHERVSEELRLYRDPIAARAELRAMLAAHGVGEPELDEITAFEDWRAFVSGVVEPTTPVVGGETLSAGGRTWEVVYTPGHSQSHICLFSPTDRILISGDHLLPAITPHIDFRRGDDDPLGQFMASLEKIERLAPELVLPGHGRPFEDGAERARVVIRHHDRRLGSILQVIRHEARSADEITDEIFGTALLDFHRRLALGEALAHLAYLRQRSEVERIEEDGRYKYRKARRIPVTEVAD